MLPIYITTFVVVFICLYVVWSNWYDKKFGLKKDKDGNFITSGTSKIIEVLADKIYPNSIVSKYKANEPKKGIMVKGITNNHSEHYGQLLKDIFIPVPNTFFVDKNRNEHQLFEGFIPYHIQTYNLDNFKNLYGSLTLAYLSAIVANHMSYLKMSMVKFEDKGHKGLTTERMELEVGKYDRTNQGYYLRNNTKEKLYIKKLYKTTKYPVLEDLIGPIDNDSVNSHRLPRPLDKILETMTKDGRSRGRFKALIKGIPMKNLHSLDPTSDIKLTSLRNRYFFNSNKEINTEWLAEEMNNGIKEVNEWLTTNMTYGDFFAKCSKSLSPFGQMYLYNFFYYYVLNHLVNKVVEYCNSKNELGATKEIFSELFTFRYSKDFDLQHAVKISPDYITGVLMENQYVNSGVMKLFHMDQVANQHSLSLVSVNRNEGILLRPSMDMKAEEFKPVLTFNAYLVQSFIK